MSNNNNTNLAAERRERIIRILKQRHILSVHKLCNIIRVSPATIRRDLAEMEQRGYLHRVHGGAVYSDNRMEEVFFDDKEIISAKEKQAIAKKALDFIKPNDSIFLDGGSTVLAMARLLVNTKNITVVTNSLRVATAFSCSGPRTILIGGEFRRLSQTFVGSLTSHLINQIYIDTAFMGTIGLSKKEGLTTTDPREAYTKRLVMSHSKQVVLLADNSKIGKVSFSNFGTLNSVNLLITDSGIEKKVLAEFRKKGIKTIIAQ